MRIAYLHQYFNTPAMQGGTRSYEMARRWVQRDHEVQMFTTWRQPTNRTNWFITDESGIEVHWLPVAYSNHMSHVQRMRAFAQFAWAAARKVAGASADVIFATSTPLTIALPGLYAARRTKAPMVFEVRDLWPEVPIAMGALRSPVFKWAARNLAQLAYRASGEVIALSPMMRDGIVRTGYPSERITVVPNGADLELFDPANSDARAFLTLHPELAGKQLVIYAGALGTVNNVGYLVDVARAALALDPSICFVVIGEGREKADIRRKAVEQDVLGRNLFLLPGIPKSSMPSVFAAADISVSLVANLEPLWANSANKVFDTLASGTPLAINYGGWQAELIESTGAGLVLPHNSPGQAARMLVQALGDSVWLDRAGRQARATAEMQFGRDLLADRVEEVLVRVVQKAVCPHGTYR